MDAGNAVLYYAVLRGCATSTTKDSHNSHKKSQKQKGDGKPVLVTKNWLNAQAREQDASLPPVCYHWYRLGKCVYGPLCKFRHPPEMAAQEQKERGVDVEEIVHKEDDPGSYDMKAIAAERRKLFAKITEHEVEGKKKRNRGEGRRNRIRNDCKAGCFRRWLIDTYGMDLLCSGSGVLDVAGGKGELSFELVNLSNIPSTLIDPRPMEITHFKKRLLYGLYYKNLPFQVYNTRPKITKEEEIDTPKHLRIFFTSNLANEDNNSNNNKDTTTQLHEEKTTVTKSKAQILEEAYAAALKVQWTTKGLERTKDVTATTEEEAEKEEEESDDEEDHHEGGSKETTEEEERQMQAEQEDFCRTADWVAIEQLLSNASAVVGMHPDQAAEHIVDFALKSGKPFAVVPCCTYHREFPHRKRPNGQFVKQYEHLIEYLVAKDPERIGVETLDFEGKNKVVFLKPAYVGNKKQ